MGAGEDPAVAARKARAEKTTREYEETGRAQDELNQLERNMQSLDITQVHGLLAARAAGGDGYHSRGAVFGRATKLKVCRR